MQRERKYAIGYKPNVSIISCVFKYYDKKYHNKLKSKSTYSLYEKFIVVVPVDEIIVTLNDDNNFVTEKEKQSVINKIIKTHNIPFNNEKHFGGIRDIKLIRHIGKVSYDFDEFKH